MQPRRRRAVLERRSGVAKMVDLLRAVPRRPRHAGDAALPRACSRCARTAMALALFTSTQLPLVRRDHDRRGRRRAHALVDGGRARRRRRAVDARRAAARPAHAPDRRAKRRAAAAASRASRATAAHHEVRAAGRLFRLRIWLSSAMWVPVLATNVVAVGARRSACRSSTSTLGDATSLPIGRSRGRRRSSARSPAG